ncbi:transposase (fragment) [Tenacibaculum sediminilitoris]|uniref:transposase n=1 Tax=Tenacibaculum sediminilitoris TaxID=1820334 RepID=UPI00389315EA
MLEGKLNTYLDYNKHEQPHNNNTRNGYASKKVKTALAQTTIKTPRNRKAFFNLVLVLKRTNMVVNMRKEMSNSDIEKQVREVYDFNNSTSTIPPSQTKLPIILSLG